MISRADITELGLSDWEDVPTAVLASLRSDADWIRLAQEHVPEMLDLRDGEVRGGFFADTGTARGLIWDLLARMETAPSSDVVRRTFDFILSCAASDDPELYNPAMIGFVCKVAYGPDAPLTLDELSARLPAAVLNDWRELLMHHYGAAGFEVLTAAKSGRRRH